MEQYYATVGPEGELEIPAAICESLGIVDGTRIAIRVEGDRVIVTPQTLLAQQQIIEELCGLTVGGPSMCDELIADRRAEDVK
ncbi:MAG: AbrB/MazE/SpoVT family DNA-binding domain-containing protein [Terracidiphilus sp.]|jgi:antitoxin component of MazEF toxin-antitoxin module